jgi:hypothetical protein
MPSCVSVYLRDGVGSHVYASCQPDVPGTPQLKPNKGTPFRAMQQCNNAAMLTSCRLGCPTAVLCSGIVMYSCHMQHHTEFTHSTQPALPTTQPRGVHPGSQSRCPPPALACRRAPA